MAAGVAARISENDLDDDLVITPEGIEDALAILQEKGRSRETVQTYQARLCQFYNWLPEGDKEVRRGTLERWRKDLISQGYAARTVNQCVSAVNTFLEISDHREMQVDRPLDLGDDIQPELTRKEYLRLLSTARLLGKEREYLMIKVFAATGLSVRQLPFLTLEATTEGTVSLPDGVVHIAECLRRELLDYAGREGIRSGPLFVTSRGSSYRRTSVTTMIQRLCGDARVPPEKCNPRCLRKLYQTTQAGIHANIALLAEQSHDRLLETEQLAIGWNQRARARG